jgi:hypothetical protein
LSFGGVTPAGRMAVQQILQMLPGDAVEKQQG